MAWGWPGDGLGMAWGWPGDGLGDGLLVAVVLVVLDSHSQEIADTKQELTEKHEMLEKTKTLGSREIWGSPNRVHVPSGNSNHAKEHIGKLSEFTGAFLIFAM